MNHEREVDPEPDPEPHSLTVGVQVVSAEHDLPGEPSLRQWASMAWSQGVGFDANNSEKHRAPTSSELTIRIVDEPEAAELNGRYRDRSGPTNVLSFPFEPLPGVDVGLLGDIVVCAPVVKREATDQAKALEQHWAHMVVHGVLHLLGFDHQDAEETAAMEGLETEILRTIGYPSPY